MSNNQSTALVPSNYTEVKNVAITMAKSGFFAVNNPTQAFVQILAGQELGIAPFAAMSQISIIKGKPVIGAAAIGGLIKRSGKYNYKVVEHTDERCAIEFYERWDGKWEKIGESSFTAADAKRAGLNTPVWRSYPRNMLFARAISNGAKWHCPDITQGSIYYEGELEGDAVEPSSSYTPPPTNSNVETMDVDFEEVVEAEVAPQPAPNIPAVESKPPRKTPAKPASLVDFDPKRDFDAEAGHNSASWLHSQRELRAVVREACEMHPKWRELEMLLLDQVRALACVDSSKEMSAGQIRAHTRLVRGVISQGRGSIEHWLKAKSIPPQDEQATA